MFIMFVLCQAPCVLRMFMKGVVQMKCFINLMNINTSTLKNGVLFGSSFFNIFVARETK